MKNFPGIFIGVVGLAATAFCFAIYRKDKEIEKNCNCKKTIEETNPNGSGDSRRVANIQVTTGAVIGSNGGGRSAQQMRVGSPGGVAVATLAGGNSNSSFTKNSFTGDNRRLELYEKLFQRDLIKSDPVVSANGTKAIANGPRQTIHVN